jgi:hypothetical protein
MEIDDEREKIPTEELSDTEFRLYISQVDFQDL